MAGGMSLAQLLSSTPPSSVAAINFGTNGSINRVEFFHKSAPPHFARGASRTRSTPVGPAHPGCGPDRAPKSARRSPARCAARGPPRAPDRGCPLLCARQSLAWRVPTLPVFAADIPSATRRFVCRARRLRAFKWLVRQFFARRLLARVVRGSMLLARALNRIKVARLYGTSACELFVRRAAAPAPAMPPSAPPSSPLGAPPAAPPSALPVAPVVAPLAAPLVAPPTTPPAALGTSPLWGDEAVGLLPPHADRNSVAPDVPAASRERAARARGVGSCCWRDALLARAKLKRQLAADSDGRSSSSSRSVAACRRRGLPALPFGSAPRTFYPYSRASHLPESKSLFVAHAPLRYEFEGSPPPPLHSRPPSPLTNPLPPPPLLFHLNSVT